MNPPDPREWHRLFNAALNDQLSNVDKLELATLLKSSAEARTLWFLYHDNECSLAEMQRSVRIKPRKPRLPWLSWRPLSAAAGLLLGILCTSMVLAYVGPSQGRVMSLFQESFEAEPAPAVAGVPIEVGKWSGDYTEVVGEQQGVKPASGKQMLRFLRGDYEGKSIPSSHSSDVFRLVDLRPYRHEFADGGAVVQLTAVFNAMPFPEDETFHCTLTIFALDASLIGNDLLRMDNVLSRESLAFSRSSKVVVDRDPVTWQKVSNELRVPPATDYLMLRIGMSNDTKSRNKARDRFAGHFVDKVQLIIVRRPEIAVP